MGFHLFCVGIPFVSSRVSVGLRVQLVVSKSAKKARGSSSGNSSNSRRYHLLVQVHVSVVGICWMMVSKSRKKVRGSSSGISSILRRYPVC